MAQDKDRKEREMGGGRKVNRENEGSKGEREKGIGKGGCERGENGGRIKGRKRTKAGWVRDAKKKTVGKMQEREREEERKMEMIK